MVRALRHAARRMGEGRDADPRRRDGGGARVSPPAATSARSTTSARPGGTTRRCILARRIRAQHVIKRYPKPYVALIDGIVMGGGVGVSIHGSHRVAGDRFQFAMPEVGIGFFPDVGATWFLPRLPGELGTYCALTGERLKTRTRSPPASRRITSRSARCPELIDALSGRAPVDARARRVRANEPARADRPSRRDAIDRLFAVNRVEDILAGARPRGDPRQSDDGDWAGATAATMRTQSPTSLKIALAQMRRAKFWSFADCMRAEFRIVSRIVHGHDFYEGVRAVIIDKDNQPRWRAGDARRGGRRRCRAPLRCRSREELDLP